MNLKAHYQPGTTVDFGSVVNYTCVDGFFFDIDYFMVGFNSTCFENGTWSQPKWERCIDPTSKLENNKENGSKRFQP